MRDDDVARAQLFLEEGACTPVLLVYPGLVILDLSEVIHITLVERRLLTRCEPQRGPKKALARRERALKRRRTAGITAAIATLVLIGSVQHVEVSGGHDGPLRDERSLAAIRALRNM